MEMMIYVNGKQVSGVISGCEYIGEAWVKAQELAEMLDVSCALVSAETGEVIAWWEPQWVPFVCGAPPTFLGGENFEPWALCTNSGTKVCAK